MEYDIIKDNIQMLWIRDVSYSTITWLQTHVQSDPSDQKIHYSSLSKIGPIPTI